MLWIMLRIDARKNISISVFRRFRLYLAYPVKAEVKLWK